MAEWTLAERRLISGKGIFKGDLSFKYARAVCIAYNVVRKPNQPYLNFNWNPLRSKYAFCTYLEGDWVVGEESITYPRQKRIECPDPSGQTLIALKCAYQGTLETIRNLGASLGSPEISFENDIVGYKNLPTPWDTIKMVCYADSAVEIMVYFLPYDSCNSDYVTFPSPPPLDNDARTPVSPGTPLSGIALPYDGDTDNGDSVPYSGDTNPSPVTLRVVYHAYASGTYPDLGDIPADFSVPDATYVASLVSGIAPSACPSQQPQRTIATSTIAGRPVITLLDHNTCNRLEIVSQAYLV